MATTIDGVAAEIAPFSRRIEADRRLPPEVVQALVRAGVFKLAVPRSLGGAEVRPIELLRAVERLARVDGSAGWCAMIGATSGLMSGYLPESLAREVYGPDDAITASVFAPTGRAVRESGAVRVSGRWAFASGCEHASFRSGGVLLGDDPRPMSVMFRADETKVLDTWHVSGLRGTGSHDFVVEDLVVPEERLYSLFREPWPTSVLYRVPLFGLLAAGIGAVALGIAAGAVESFTELAKSKTQLGAKKGIAHRETVQLALAGGAAKVHGARSLLEDAVGSITAASESRPVTLEERARLRIAIGHVTAEAAAAVDLVYEAGGGSSIYDTSPLQRAFRDVHTVTQHVMVHKTSMTLAGRVLLGLETETSTL
jgi:alkylation response protein AidB-like acyl-CoA dehydrogenase